MGRPTWDEMKLARDGHLDPTKVAAKDHAWVRPIWDKEERLPNGNILRTFADGSAIEYG